MRSAKRGLAALLCLVVATPHLGAEDERSLLDATTGVIDGQTAIAIYPLRYEGRKADDVLPTEGCTASLMSRTTFAVLEQPCGEWFVAPPDEYDYWAENEGQISPYSKKLVYFGGPFGGKGMAGGVPLGPAGRVRIPDGFEPTPELQLRLLHVETPSVEGLMRGSISRRLSFSGLGGSLQMPAGRTIASVWDARVQRYVMLSRPFDLQARSTIAPPLDEPTVDRAHLVAQVVRHTRVHRVDGDLVKVRLGIGSELREPDVRLGDADRVYAIWYDLPHGEAELVAEVDGAELQESVSVSLGAGRIARAIGNMVEVAPAGPGLDVEVELPSSVAADGAKLSLYLDTELLNRADVGQDAWTWSWSDLPAAALRLELETSLGKLQETVDLTDHEDAFVRLAPDVLVVQGTVHLGDETHQGEMTATTVTRQSIDLTSDIEGLYEFVSLEPIRSISVDLGSERPPFVEIFFDAISESTWMDLEIPDNRYEVQVVDAASGQAVVGAKVIAKNRYVFERGERSRKKAVSQYATTDEEGLALLPALRSGEVELMVEADGYLDPEPIRAEVQEDVSARSLQILLEPEGAKADLMLELPDGRPASGAAVYVVDAAGNLLSESAADREGRAEVAASESPGAMLLVRHPAAAFLAERWSADAEDTVHRRLEPASPPLRVRVMDAWGEEPARHARLALWVGGELLAERNLLRLSGKRPLADEHGYWTIEGLPQGRLAAVAWLSGSEDGRELARMRAQATDIDIPWPETVEVRLVGSFRESS